MSLTARDRLNGAQPTVDAKPRGSVWPRVSPRFTAAALSGHSAVALAAGALIYLVCLTGAISVLVDEMRLVEQPAPAATVLPPGALDRAVAAVAEDAKPTDAIYALWPQTPRQRATVELFGGGKEVEQLVDAQGGLHPLNTAFTEFVTGLHMTLTLPAPWGSLLVGAAGAALLSLILSGVLSHPRIFRDAFRLKLSGSKRLREAELHNRLSVWGLPFHVVVTLTGAFFGLAQLGVMLIAAIAFHGDVLKVYAPLGPPQVTANAAPAPLPSVEGLVARAIAERPGSHLHYVGIERAGTAGSRITVQLASPDRLPRGDLIAYDAQGHRVGAANYATGDLGLQAYSAAANLHFGFFGGLPVRIAYVLLGLALTYICATGISIWLARRRDRGRPAPRLERAWSAWTWGAPAALILAALAAPWLSPAWVFWGLALTAQPAALAWPMMTKAQARD